MTQTAKDLFARALAAAEAGDAPGWEANLRACLELDPNHGIALLNLGRILFERQQYEEAETIFRRSFAAQPMLENLTGLAEVFEATDRPAKAEARYHDILKVMPAHAPTLRRLGDLYERNDNAEVAASYYKQAWELDPKDYRTAVEYAIMVFDSDPAATMTTFDRLLTEHAQDDAARMKILNKLIIYKEFHERTQRGLMPFHATSPSELFFTYAAAEFALFRDLVLKAAAARPNDTGAIIGQFLALFCSRDRDGAQYCLDRLHRVLKNHILCAVTLDPNFYRQLESQSDEVLLAGLPPLIDVKPATLTGPHITYLSCNFKYFVGFALPLLRSFATTTPGGQVHVHIMDATDDELRAVAAFCHGLSPVTVAVSAERPDAEKLGPSGSRFYYHSVRFIRFYQHLKLYGRTLWMMDVDALFNRSASEMYKVLGDNDAAFRIRAGRLEPWNQFSAAVIGASPKPASVAYFRLIAAYIAHFFRRGQLQWGIDQFAMYGAFSFLEDDGRSPQVAFLDDRVMDQQYLPEGIVWFTAGRKKFLRPGTELNVSLSKRAAARMKYWDLFQKYGLGKSTGA